MHHHVIMKHIQLKFHEILYIGYFDTAQFVNLTPIQGQHLKYYGSQSDKNLYANLNYGDTYLL